MTDLSPSYLETLLNLPISGSHRSVIALFNLKTFKPEFVSKNCEEILGYSHEEPMQHGIMFFFEHLSPEHSKILMMQSQWLKTNLDQIPFEDKVNLRTAYCGMQFSHPKKQWIRLLIQHNFYEVNEERNPIRTFSTMTDVTHLMKNDNVWFRLQYGADNPRVRTYDFKSEITSNNDMISDREKEILLLIAQGQDAVEIGKSLFISPNTVNNHRQNMLNRLGARDATALIQICSSCGII
jgi:DNA-binding CsgD family transcriptional regulator